MLKGFFYFSAITRQIIRILKNNKINQFWVNLCLKQLYKCLVQELSVALIWRTEKSNLLFQFRYRFLHTSFLLTKGRYSGKRPRAWKKRERNALFLSPTQGQRRKRDGAPNNGISYPDNFLRPKYQLQIDGNRRLFLLLLSVPKRRRQTRCNFFFVFGFIVKQLYKFLPKRTRIQTHIRIRNLINKLF